MRKVLGAILLLVFAPAVLAQAGKAPWEEFGQRIQASEKVAPLGNNAFGDEVSLSNGALSFSAADVSIPGNSGLPVAVGRNYSVRDRRYYQSDSMFADWDADLPQISAVFAQNWLTASGGTSRCSNHTAPPAPSGYLYSDFWQGISLKIPGVGGGDVLSTDPTLVPNTIKPSTGGPWYWIAGNQIHLSCQITVKNTTGEGFLAITPDGTKYWFDWMAQQFEPTLRRPVTVQGIGGEVPTARRKNILYATRVEDRFGNWVTYTYTNAWNAPGKLTAINSNDGRQLTLTHNGDGHVSTVSDGTRTWTYTYGSTSSGRKTLTQVSLPDTSAWAINFTAFTNAEIQYTEVFAPGEIYRTCRMLETPLNYASEPVGTITHPAGAIGTFTVNIKEHARSSVTLDCGNYTSPGNNQNDDVNLWPISYHGLTLKTKQVSGPGLTTAAWNYAYVNGKHIHMYPGTTFMYPRCVASAYPPGHALYHDCWKPPCQSAACAGSSTTTVTGPNSEWSRYTHGNTWMYDEGKLKKVESGTNSSNILRTTTNTYDLSQVNHAPLSYPARYGGSTQVSRSGFASEYHRPLLSSTTALQGVNFTRTVTAYDYYARPTSEDAGAQTQLTEYHDDTAKWVIGQIKKSTKAGIEVDRVDYDAANLPWKLHSFGLLIQTLTYNGDGTIATAKDGNNRTTTVSNWYRGVPKNVQFADLTTQSANVNAHGFVTSVTDENNFTTTYGYDDLGRMISLAHPSGEGWTGTSIAYDKVAGTEFGITTGHWRQTVTRGNYRKVIYFDGLWRPVIEHEYDNGAMSATQRYKGWKYDHEGRVSFAGYPRSTASSIASFTTGTTTTYDALGRQTKVSQTTEYPSPAETIYAYLSGFKTRVTNPRGYWTETQYLTFGQPSTDYPTNIVAAGGQAEQQTTVIARNTLGNPTSVTRSGTYGGSGVSATRSYVYDTNQRLCKRVEPETGATLIDYDGAQNIAWSAEGSTLTTLACNRGSVTAGDKVTRGYDLRNRLTLVNYPDATADISTGYYPDGAVQWTTTGATTVNYQ